MKKRTRFKNIKTFTDETEFKCKMLNTDKPNKILGGSIKTEYYSLNLVFKGESQFKVETVFRGEKPLNHSRGNNYTIFESLRKTMNIWNIYSAKLHHPYPLTAAHW